MSSASRSVGRSSDQSNETKFFSNQLRSTATPVIYDTTLAPTCISRMKAPAEGSELDQEGHKKYLIIADVPSCHERPRTLEINPKDGWNVRFSDDGDRVTFENTTIGETSMGPRRHYKRKILESFGPTAEVFHSLFEGYKPEDEDGMAVGILFETHTVTPLTLGDPSSSGHMAERSESAFISTSGTYQEDVDGWDGKTLIADDGLV